MISKLSLSFLHSKVTWNGVFPQFFYVIIQVHSMSVANMQRKIRIDIIILSCVLNIISYRGHFKREILEFFHTFFELWGINKYRVINMIKQNVNWEYLGTEYTCNLIYWFKKITPVFDSSYIMIIPLFHLCPIFWTVWVSNIYLF